MFCSCCAAVPPYNAEKLGPSVGPVITVDIEINDAVHHNGPEVPKLTTVLYWLYRTVTAYTGQRDAATHKSVIT